jgi:hypothetical protein
MTNDEDRAVALTAAYGLGARTGAADRSYAAVTAGGAGTNP